MNLLIMNSFDDDEDFLKNDFIDYALDYMGVDDHNDSTIEALQEYHFKPEQMGVLDYMVPGAFDVCSAKDIYLFI